MNVFAVFISCSNTVNDQRLLCCWPPLTLSLQHPVALNGEMSSAQLSTITLQLLMLEEHHVASVAEKTFLRILESV